MPAYAAVPFVQQHLLDAIGAWVERATGLRLQHGEQNATKPAAPYVSAEWLEEPGPTSPRVEREEASLPSSATLTLTAAEGGWSAAAVNLARPALLRDGGEALTDFADRWAAVLSALVAGRLEVVRVGVDDVEVTPVVQGDLWRAVGIEGVDVVVGEGLPARIAERIYEGLVRIWVVGAARTAAKAGTAGDGAGVMEVIGVLAESIVEPWCRDLMDQRGVRVVTPEPRPATARSRRSNAAREVRAYIDVGISITSRFAVAPDTVTTVGFGIGVQPVDPDAEPVVVEIELEP